MHWGWARGRALRCMFAAFVLGAAGVAAAAASARGSHEVRGRRNAKVSIDERLDWGERAWHLLLRNSTPEDAERYYHAVTSEPPLAARLPRQFWCKFFQSMNLQYSDHRRMKALRSLRFFLRRRKSGALTREAMRGDIARGNCRRPGGARNSLKTPSLGFHLLQWFVDKLQNLTCRADSTILMTEAREQRAYLAAHGTDDSALPKLNGNAGYSWFKRWRVQYQISWRVIGMKLKVSWRKVCRRVRVLLRNIFRFLCGSDISDPFSSVRTL